jgi:hypothetical protein
VHLNVFSTDFGEVEQKTVLKSASTPLESEDNDRLLHTYANKLI